MDKFETKLIVTSIEHLLTVKFRPTFLAIMEPTEEIEDVIQIVLSCNMFNYIPINERVLNVFNAIYNEFPFLRDSYLIVVQTFSSEEMDHVLDDVFSRELE